jgi:hypothetical protein
VVERVKVLHADGPLGWVPIPEDMPDEVDDEESKNFADFNNDEDVPGVTNEQRTLAASFEFAHRSKTSRHLMGMERQVLSNMRATTQRDTSQTYL